MFAKAVVHNSPSRCVLPPAANPADRVSAVLQNPTHYSFSFHFRDVGKRNKLISVMRIDKQKGYVTGYLYLELEVFLLHRLNPDVFNPYKLTADMSYVLQ